MLDFQHHYSLTVLHFFKNTKTLKRTAFILKQIFNAYLQNKRIQFFFKKKNCVFYIIYIIFYNTYF